MTRKDFNKMAAYVRSCVEDYEERVAVALNVMNTMHYPLSVVSPVLYGQMMDACEEWASENGVNLGVSFDVEELLWK